MKIETKINNHIDLLTERLKRRKGFSRLYFLYENLTELDHGIFNVSWIMESTFRTEIISMLETKDLALERLSTSFIDYKEKWNVSKSKYFESLDEIGYKTFIKEYNEILPQDIRDAVKKCKSVDLTDLKLTDSVDIFTHYYTIREWLKARIEKELEDCKLSDNELLLLANSEKIKYEWLGNAVELVGLLDLLESKKWILPQGSYRSKSAYILKCFKFNDKERKIDYITSIYKKSSMNYEPFKNIVSRI
jgi:hypothetical protein